MEAEDHEFESRCDGADMWTAAVHQPMTPVSKYILPGMCGHLSIYQASSRT